MTAAEFVAELQARGIRVWAEGERLRYDAPAGGLTPDLRDQLRARKAALLEYFEQARTDQVRAATRIRRSPHRAGNSSLFPRRR